MATPKGTVYLIHFDAPYKHARHYIGCTCNLERRIAEHRRGDSTKASRLMAAVHDANIGWDVVRTWEGDYNLEKRLQATHNGARLCPICQAAKAAHKEERGG